MCFFSLKIHMFCTMNLKHVLKKNEQRRKSLYKIVNFDNNVAQDSDQPPQSIDTQVLDSCPNNIGFCFLSVMSTTIQILP